MIRRFNHALWVDAPVGSYLLIGTRLMGWTLWRAETPVAMRHACAGLHGASGASVTRATASRWPNMSGRALVITGDLAALDMLVAMAETTTGRHLLARWCTRTLKENFDG